MIRERCIMDEQRIVEFRARYRITVEDSEFDIDEEEAEE